jgi:DNA-binding NarL/FixJ family response regulator
MNSSSGNHHGEKKLRRARVLLADDHTLVVEGFRKILEPEFDVVGTAADGDALVRQALASRPDVVLVDISMPLLNGLEAARQIKRDLPQVKILFLTMHSDLSYLRDAMCLGASGYVLKRSAGKELLTAVRTVLQGRTFIAPELAMVIEDPKFRRALERGGIPVLTTRQREILRLIALGQSNTQIAAVLKVTARTIRFHRSAIARKLGVATTPELTRYAILHRIIPG